MLRKTLHTDSARLIAVYCFVVGCVNRRAECGDESESEDVGRHNTCQFVHST